MHLNAYFSSLWHKTTVILIPSIIFLALSEWVLATEEMGEGEKRKLTRSLELLDAERKGKRGNTGDSSPEDNQQGTNYHSYSHTHFSPICSEIGAVYVSEKAYFTYPSFNNSRKGFLEEDDSNFFHRLREVYIAYPQKTPNHLFITIEAGYQGAEGAPLQWVHSPVYYDFDQRTFNADPNAHWDISSKKFFKRGAYKELNIKYVDFCSGTRSGYDVHYDIRHSCIFPFEREKREFEEFISSFALPTAMTQAKNFHSEPQALYGLYKWRNTIFDSLCQGKDKNLFKAFIIKLHSYNDVCTNCQQTISVFQSFFLDHLKKEIFPNLDYITYAGIANKVWVYNLDNMKIFHNLKCLAHPHVDGTTIEGSWNKIEGSMYADVPKYILKNNVFVENININNHDNFLFSFVKNHDLETIGYQVNRSIQELVELQNKFEQS